MGAHFVEGSLPWRRLVGSTLLPSLPPSLLCEGGEEEEKEKEEEEEEE